MRLVIEYVPCFLNSVSRISMEGLLHWFCFVLFFFSDFLMVLSVMVNVIKEVLNAELDD